MASLSSSKWLSSSPHKRKQEDKRGGGGGGGGDFSGTNGRTRTAPKMEATDRVQRWIVVCLLCLWSASIPFRYSYGTTSTRMIRTTTTLTQSPPPTTTTTPSSSGGSLSSWITPPPLLSPFPNHHNDNHNWLVWVTLTRRQPTQFPLLVCTAQALLAVPPSTSNINRNNHTSTNVYWLVVELPPLPQPDDDNDHGNLGRPRHHQKKKKKKKRQQRQPKQEEEETNNQHQTQHSHSPLDDSNGGGCTAAVRDYLHETLPPRVHPSENDDDDDHPPQPRLAWAHVCWKDLVYPYYHHSPRSDAESSPWTTTKTATTPTATAVDLLPRAIADLVQRHVVLPSLPVSSSSRSNPTTTTMVQVVYSHAGTLPLLLHVGRLHRFLGAAPTSRRRILACRQHQQQVLVPPHPDGSTTTTNIVAITLNSWLPPSWCPTKNHTAGPKAGSRNSSSSSSINTHTSTHPEQPDHQHAETFFFLPWRLEVTPGYLENVQGELWNLVVAQEQQQQDKEAPFEPTTTIQTPEHRRLVMMQRRAQWNRRQPPPPSIAAAAVGDGSSANESSSPLSPLFWEPPWDMLQVLPSLPSTTATAVEGISNHPEGRNA